MCSHVVDDVGVTFLELSARINMEVAAPFPLSAVIPFSFTRLAFFFHPLTLYYFFVDTGILVIFFPNHPQPAGT